MDRKSNSSLLRKLAKSYQLSAVLLLNTVVAVVLLNCIFSLFYLYKDHSYRNPVLKKYGDEAIYRRYTNLSIDQVETMLNETWTRSQVYSPFVGYKEQPYKGEFVNVDTNGFRVRKNQGPWPPDPVSVSIFLFGGSTTFGYGVADQETIGSHLQEYLTTRFQRQVHVYNFGCASYYSTLERILYEHLLVSGFIPDYAIFIDGLNDFNFYDDKPMHTDTLSRFVSTIGNSTVETRSFLSRTSLARAAAGPRRWLTRVLNRKVAEVGPSDATVVSNTKNEEYDDPDVIERVLRRYLGTKKTIEAISEAFGVKPMFVWQPVPTYNYNTFNHLTHEDFGATMRSRYGYQRMAKITKTDAPLRNFLWGADLHDIAEEPLYIDKVHYSPQFSKIIAEVISNSIPDR